MSGATSAATAAAAAAAAKAAQEAGKIAKQRPAKDDLLAGIARELQDLKAELAGMKDSIEKVVSLLEARQSGADMCDVRAFLKKPHQFGIEFMPGVTLGDLLKQHVKEEAIPSFCQGVGITREKFDLLAEDNVLPDKELSEKMAFVFSRGYGIDDADFFVCKAHSYSKIQVLGDKSIDWVAVETRAAARVAGEAAGLARLKEGKRTATK